MNGRKIAGWALIAVGAFFVFTVVMLTVQEQYTEFGDPKLHVAGAIQTVSGQTFLIIGIALLAPRLILRRRKVKAAAA